MKRQWAFNMCGIAGIHRFDKKPIDYKDLAVMADTFLYRGPDSGGISLLAEKPEFCRFNPCGNPPLSTRGFYSGFAHRRLAIIDTSAKGIQPLSLHNGELWITYNGEIYNYIELRRELESLGRHFNTHTDTEVLLHAYDEWGIDCMERFNGMWAFAIWDTCRRRLFISRDRFGIKPLYYTFKNGQFIFASEPKALLRLGTVSRDPDMRAVSDYLVHSRVDSFEWTFFSEIKRLEAGCYFDIGFEDGSLPEPRTWWNLSDSLHDIPVSDSECSEKFLELFKSSIKLRLRSDVPVGTCLSGGLDSTAVVCVARPWLEKGNQKTFSAVYGPGFIEDETPYIDEVTGFSDVESYRVSPSAESLLEDIEEFIYFQDEPFGSTSQYAQYKVFQLARKNGITVTLDGQGADEELAGYHYLFPIHFAGLLKDMNPIQCWNEIKSYLSLTGAPFPRTFLATLAGFLPHRSMIRWANRYDPGRNVNWVHKSIVKCAHTIQPPQVPGTYDWLNRRLYELFSISSLPALLRYEDRNSMASSIEARLPFLDHRLVSFIFSLSARQKIRNGWTKYIMREAIKGIIPESVRTRSDKIGFSTPEADWFRNNMLPYVRDVLSAPKTKKRNLYDIPKLMTLIDANASGKVNAGRAIWRALNCELWFRRFID
ncbi:asparagine synthase (glutamine-hydrolyzing) [Candidatus Latescibacterota bacterium]